jgi:hypothetical protein
MLRYGVNQQLELRLGTEFYQSDMRGISYNYKISGFNPLQTGIKLHVQEEKKWIPQITFLGSIQWAKLASKNLQLNKNHAYFRLMFQNTLSPKFFLLYNLGMNFNNDDNQLVYSAMMGFVPTKKLTFFLESFGNKSSELLWNG